MRTLRVKPSYFFATGNAGDTFARHLLRHLYAQESVCLKDEGRRLLCVGSIGHAVKAGDVVCGVGCKDVPIGSADPASVVIYGLRGPLSLERFRSAGYDTSQVKFLLDPGLFLRFMLDGRSVAPVRGRVAFIPHYRERYEAARRLPRGMHFIDIDADAMDVGKEILSSEVVLSSSLHGIIFAHALGRPAVPVRPHTPEPWSKFEDYFLSIDRPMGPPLDSVDAFSALVHDHSPPAIRYRESDFYFPSYAELKERGIAT